MSKPDYYEVLGVERSTDVSEIKSAFRKKALEYHPDRNPGNKEAEERFKLAAEAYDVLSNEQKRSVYDQFGHAGLQGGGPGFGGGFGNAEDIFSTFGDIFEDFFGGRRAGSGKRMRRGADLQTEVEIEFLEACFGIKKEVSVTHGVRCETCHGSGAKSGTKADTCSYCRGRGQVQVTQGFFTISTTCPQCRGEGSLIREKCPACSGRGVVKQTRKLSVKIPPGVSDGMRLLMRSEGEVGENGGPQGDLYVYIHVKDHAEFYREEDDIISEIKINFADLALGCELSANTIEGETKLKIRAGTDSGETIHLKGKGIANIRSGRRGDHIFKIQAVTPKDLSPKQKQILEELSKEWRGTQSHTKAKKKKKGFFN